MKRSAATALTCALCVALAQIPLANAGDTPVPPPASEKARSLPVTTSFEKVTSDGVSGYVLNIKNVSEAGLKVSVTVVPSVTFHANAKTRNLPEHLIDPGQIWSVKDLSAQDKVSLMADGFDRLDLVVP